MPAHISFLAEQHTTLLARNLSVLSLFNLEHTKDVTCEFIPLPPCPSSSSQRRSPECHR